MTFGLTVLCVALGILSAPVWVEARTIKRSPAMNLCSRSTPCGWEVYRPFMRNVEYFIKSPCECPEETHCVRVTDDISISAYVHRCRPFDETIHAWPHNNYSPTTEDAFF